MNGSGVQVERSKVTKSRSQHHRCPFEIRDATSSIEEVGKEADRHNAILYFPCML